MLGMMMLAEACYLHVSACLISIVVDGYMIILQLLLFRLSIPCGSHWSDDCAIIDEHVADGLSGLYRLVEDNHLYEPSFTWGAPSGCCSSASSAELSEYWERPALVRSEPIP